MNELELKPCPFCGGEASPDGKVTYGSNPNAWWADGTPVETAYSCNCTRCGINNRGIVGGYQTRDAAIAAWNTRAIPAVATDHLVPAQTWQPIETAPYGEVVTVKVGKMTFPAILRPSASLDEDGKDCDQWEALNEGEHPPCWSSGACWESNENGLTSMQPTHWMPLPAAPTPEVVE